MDGHGKSIGEAGFIDWVVNASEQYLKHDDELLVGDKNGRTNKERHDF